MELRDVARKLMAETEQMTGFQVAVTEDATLPTPSTVHMAAWDRPSHLIRIHPKAPPVFDYYVVYYCRMIHALLREPTRGTTPIRRGRKGALTIFAN